jgi:hypothetical protein
MMQDLSFSLVSYNGYYVNQHTALAGHGFIVIAMGDYNGSRTHTGAHRTKIMVWES